MRILGIYGATGPWEHDPGAALVCDGVIQAVCEEERYLRIKSPWGRLPIESIAACLRATGLNMEDVDLVVHPGVIHEALPGRVASYISHYFGWCPPVRVIHHHIAHLASAYFCSGFEEAMCLSYDGYGDGVSVALARGSRRGGIEVLESLPKEASLGVFYSAITSYLGFRVSEDEYKVMGLAPYGREGAADLSEFVRYEDEGYEVSAAMYRDGHLSVTNDEPIYSDALVKALGPPRRPTSQIEQRHRDVAHAAQLALENCAEALVRRLHRRTGFDSLCIAGGVGLNCSNNAKIDRLPFVRRTFVQPAASDRGLALGCALQAAFELGEPASGALKHAHLGSGYDDDLVAADLDHFGVRHENLSDPAATAAELVAAGRVIGWYQGRAEFGPRALGHRSILADPRNQDMKDRVNRLVKRRESFRPFAPSVLLERATELFDVRGESPFMTFSVPTVDSWRERLGAVTHVNGTARIQTVHPDADPLFHRLIEHFGHLTGVPAVLNTSFNGRGEPIVETPRDCAAMFASSGLDAIIMGRHLVRK